MGWECLDTRLYCIILSENLYLSEHLYYFVWTPVSCLCYGHVVRDHYTFRYNYAESEAPSSLYAPVPVYALFSSRCWTGHSESDTNQYTKY